MATKRRLGVTMLGAALALGSASALAKTLAFDPSGVKVGAAATPTWSRGSGRIEGVDVPLFAHVASDGGVDGDVLFSSLEDACRGRCTVTRESTDLSEVFVVADVASDLCPKCQPLNASTAPTLFDDAWAVSVIRAGGAPAIVLASPVGPLIQSLRRRPGDRAKAKYEGVAGATLAPELEIQSQAAYTFAKTRVHMVSGRLGRGVDDSYARVGAALADEGYAWLQGDAVVIDGAHAAIGQSKKKSVTRRRGTWVKGKAAVQVQVDAAPAATRNAIGNNATVVIHEVEAE